MSTEKISWHTEIFHLAAGEVLSDLSRLSLLQQFYLAGGTGLALMRGHRLSRDFDFFSTDLFNEEILIGKMQELKDLTILAKDQHTLHIVFKNIKVSFLGYNYPLLFQTKKFQSPKFPGISLHVADIRDIACMKLTAIAGRGTKRDFVDLYIAAQRHGLPELLKFFYQKYSQTPYNKIHILKSMTYFADAELDPMPDMSITLSWATVKQFFMVEVPKLL
ncbi:MAG: nucleotidyl transferase AbiEii/AbiGii toxin family protein [Ignavibacteria bacterium]|jgi:hypothetical protein